MQNAYSCQTLSHIAYPPFGIRPPQLDAYPHPIGTTRVLFIGWNPPRPYGGFWSLKFSDNLRNDLHSILKECGEIKHSTPNQEFLDEFLGKGFYFIHTVKCCTDANYPGFGRDRRSKGGKERRGKIGLPLLSACVRTHLENELATLSPINVVALGELAFLGLCELYPNLKQALAKPTDGYIFLKEIFGLPWPLLYTCFPQCRVVPVRGSNDRKKATELAHQHIRKFLEG